MTASLRLTNTEVFPPGTVVKAYQARGGAHPFPGPLPPLPGTAPPAAAPVIAEGTMGSESVTLTGLEAGTFYLVGGQVAGVWRWVEMRTDPVTEAGGGSGISQAEADARYLQLATADLTYALVRGKFAPLTVTSSPVVLKPLSEATGYKALLETDATFTMPAVAPAEGALIFMAKQDGVGSRKATFTGVHWDEETVPTPSTEPGWIDIYSFLSDGVAWYGKLVGRHK